MQRDAYPGAEQGTQTHMPEEKPPKDDDQSTGGNAGADTTNTTSQTEKVLTQDEVNRIAAAEKAQGKRAAAAEIADQLGVSVEEAANIIKAHKEQQDAEKSEAQKAREKADRETAEAQQAKAEAAAERHAAKVERLLIKAGMDPDSAEDFVPSVRAQVGATDEELVAAVDTAKAKFAPLFKKAAAPGDEDEDRTPPGALAPPRPPSQDGSGGKPPRHGKGGEDLFKRGMERGLADSRGEPDDAVPSMFAS